MTINFSFKNFIILLSTLLVIALVWLLVTTDFSLFHRAESDHYDIFMTNVHAIKLDKLGKMRDELFSPTMKHYQINDTTLAETPKFIFYGNGAPWHITGDHGEMLNGNQKIILWDNVVIKQMPGPGSHDATLTTTKVYFYPNSSYAETDQPVILTQPGSVMHGVGMTADLKKGTMKILSKTEGIYGNVSK